MHLHYVLNRVFVVYIFEEIYEIMRPYVLHPLKDLLNDTVMLDSIKQRQEINRKYYAIMSTKENGTWTLKRKKFMQKRQKCKKERNDY